VAATHCMERSQQQQAKGKKPARQPGERSSGGAENAATGRTRIQALEEQVAAEAGDDHPAYRGHRQKPAQDAAT